MSGRRFDPTKLKQASRSTRSNGLAPEEIDLLVAENRPAPALGGTVAAEAEHHRSTDQVPVLTLVEEGVGEELQPEPDDGAPTNSEPDYQPLPAAMELTEPEVRRKRSYALPAELHTRIHAFERSYLTKRRERLPRGAFLCDALARLPDNDAGLEDLLDAAERRDRRLLVQPVNAAVPDEIHLALTDLSYRRDRRVSLNRLATELVDRYLSAAEVGGVEPPSS